jgi:hypothetical protein
MSETPDKSPTGTDMLISIMEKFAEGEPTHMVVAWLDENGDLSTSTNCGDIVVIGIADYIRMAALERLRKQS